MFQRVIDDFKDSTGRALRLTSLAAVAGLALFITISFLCAAAFVFILQRHGPIEACLAGAGLFFVVAVVAAVSYKMRKDQAKARAAQRTKSALQNALSDPALVATGIQLIRAVGIKRLIPILAVGGVALGLLAGRTPSGEKPPAE
jgi:high-affinity Fe2+/Pb2+ permease